MADPRDFESFAVGESAAVEVEVGADDVDRYAQLTGDVNPLHLDDQFAASMGSGRRVVHGMLTAGYVSRVIGTVLPGPGSLWVSQSLQFRAPVRIGDRIRVEACIRHVSPGTRTLVLEIQVRNQRRQVVLDGEARVQVLDKIPPVVAEARTARTAVVTGSGRGIGAAVARRLGADGLQVVVNYRHNRDAAEQTADSIRAAGGRASVFEADVSDASEAAALIAHAFDEYGPVDVLVNNAGGPIDARPVPETSWKEMEGHLAVHLGGAVLCVQAVLPSMIERRFGRIVNIVSQSAFGTPPPKMAGYVVAKASLAAYTRCLALELGPSGVTANAVAPGMVETDMVGEVPARLKMALAAQAPLRRLAGVDDVAEAVAFLVGPGGSYVTGQTIHLSGGQVMT